jgi:sec-independent protein translocase protein TatA
MFAGLTSPVHLVILLLIILLLFGAQRLPELGRSLGQGIQEFKKGVNTEDLPTERRNTEAVEDVEKARAKAADEEDGQQRQAP